MTTVNSIQIGQRSSAPDTPAADQWRMFFLSDGLYYQKSDGTVIGPVAPGSSITLTVEEEDGTPSVANVTEIRVTNGTLTDNGGGSVSISTGGGGGGGNVTGPGSSTDNALARFDGVTGQLLQNSVGILDDSGNLSGVTLASAATPSAIHDDVAGEIAAITAKATPTTSDLLLIEDAADSNNKKRITIGDLPGGGGGATQLDELSDVSSAAQTANFVLAAGDGSTGGDYRGRALVTDDLPTIPVAGGGTGQTTATAGFDALSPATTQGDIIYRGASNNTRLAIGTAGQVLTVAGGVPTWAASSGSGASDFYTTNEAGDYSTTSASFVDVDATNLALTITTAGGDVDIWFTGTFKSTSTTAFFLNVDVDGTPIGGDGIVGARLWTTGLNSTQPISFVYRVSGLSAGTHTFTLQWRTLAGTLTLHAAAGSSNGDVPAQFGVREV